MDDSTNSKADKPARQKASRLEHEKRILVLGELIVNGTYKREIEAHYRKEWNLGYKGFNDLWNKALSTIKDTFHEPIEELRAKYISELNNDMITAYNRFKHYDSMDGVKYNALGQQWFAIYLKVKAEIAEYYPGMKPDKAPEIEDQVRLVFMADDGKVEEEF